MVNNNNNNRNPDPNLDMKKEKHFPEKGLQELCPRPLAPAQINNLEVCAGAVPSNEKKLSTLVGLERSTVKC